MSNLVRGPHEAEDSSDQSKHKIDLNSSFLFLVYCVDLKCELCRTLSDWPAAESRSSPGEQPLRHLVGGPHSHTSSPEE